RAVRPGPLVPAPGPPDLPGGPGADGGAPGQPPGHQGPAPPTPAVPPPRDLPGLRSRRLATSPRHPPPLTPVLFEESGSGGGAARMAGVVDLGSVTCLDHAATTPLRVEARVAMLPWLGERFGNPSGAHRVARAARQAIDEARDAIAAVLGATPNEIVFTGG